jgi:hypothetical protein
LIALRPRADTNPQYLSHTLALNLT